MKKILLVANFVRSKSQLPFFEGAVFMCVESKVSTYCLVQKQMDLIFHSKKNEPSKLSFQEIEDVNVSSLFYFLVSNFFTFTLHTTSSLCNKKCPKRGYNQILVSWIKY